MLWIRIGLVSMQIRIRHFRSLRIRIQFREGYEAKTEKFESWKENSYYFFFENLFNPEASIKTIII